MTSLTRLLRAGLLTGCLLLLNPAQAEGAKAKAPAPRAPIVSLDQTVQLKLRDLLGLVPTKDAGEMVARLKAIEERLIAIEALLKTAAAPIPLPAPVPAEGTRK